jgi:hypothetical protein
VTFVIEKVLLAPSRILIEFNKSLVDIQQSQVITLVYTELSPSCFSRCILSGGLVKNMVDLQHGCYSDCLVGATECVWE